LNQDFKIIKGYTKLHKGICAFIEEFLKKHMELIFLKFDPGLILAILTKLIMPNISESDFAVRSAALLGLDSFNEFVFNNLKKPSRKRPALAV